MTRNSTQSIGTSKVPAILKYPPFSPLNITNNIKNIFSYVIEHYGRDGLSLLIQRIPDKDDVRVLFGDWNGNIIDLRVPSKYSANAESIMNPKSGLIVPLLAIMKTTKILQAQYYFSLKKELTLVDVQVSLNKFLSPGFVRDLFGKIIATQNVLAIEAIDDRVLGAIDAATGTYTGDLIIKPSSPKNRLDDRGYTPLYVEVVR